MYRYIVLVFVLVVVICLAFERGVKSLVINVSMQIYLHFVCVVQIYLISVWGIELDLIPV